MTRADFDHVNEQVGHIFPEQMWTASGHVEAGAVLRHILEKSLTEAIEKFEERARG